MAFVFVSIAAGGGREWLATWSCIACNNFRSEWTRPVAHIENKAFSLPVMYDAKTVVDVSGWLHEALLPAMTE
jgi:hypothetical protein